MADRFPLILNTSANQIQEIASGDSLDLSGNNIANAGIITANNVTIGAATTDLIVNGDARITGILTIGTSSLKLDGPNNLVNVGTALTLGHTQGLQFHTQNLHSAGFEVNQINVSGASTMGGDVTFTGDNYNVLWDKSQDQLEFADNAKASFGTGGDLKIYHNGSGSYIDDSSGTGELILKSNSISFTNAAENEYLARFFQDSAVELYHNNTKRFETTTSGVTVTGDGTFTGNVSIGGTLTYEDVTNIDSVGIVTAREGVVIPDNKQLKFGDSTDFKIEHNTNENYIDSNSGHIYIRANVNDDEGDNIYIQPKSGENSAVFTHDGSVELYQDNSRKFFTISNGVQATNRIIVGEGNAQRGILSGDANSASVGSIGDITFNFIRNSQIKARIDGNDFQIPTDNGKIELGASQDLEIFHNGSHSYIKNAGTGSLLIQGSQVALQSTTGENMIIAQADGLVQLNYDHSKKFETTSSGVTVTGTINFGSGMGSGLNSNGFNINFADSNGSQDMAKFGDSGDLKIYHQSNSSYIINATGNLNIGSNNEVRIKGGSDVAENMAVFKDNGSVELYHDGTKKFETSANGILIPDGQRVAFDTDNYLTCNNTANTLEFVVGGTGVGEYFSGGFRFNDSQQIRVGSGNDTRFYHSGSHSYIKHTGTGNFYIDINTNDYFSVTSEESETIIQAQSNGSVELFNNGSKRFETTSSGCKSSIAGDNTFVIGSTDASGAYLVLDGDSNGDGTGADYCSLQHGTDGDFSIHCDNPSGDSQFELYTGSGSTTAIIAEAAGEVQLYYNGIQKLKTTNSGAAVTGSLGVGAASNPSHHYNQGIHVHATGTGAVLHLTDNTSGSGASDGFDVLSNAGTAYLWQRENSNMVFGTNATSRWNIYGSNGHFVPNSNNTYDIGESSKRVRNIYTNDLNLSNEGGANDVDNTWGDYTIQEGESDLFLINNRSGKKYKFNLTEVS